MEKLENFKLFILEHRCILFVAFILLGIGGFYLYQVFHYDKENRVVSDVLVESSMDIMKETEENEKNEECYITVDIKGEVKKSGIYNLKCNSRVQDVINLAGGLSNRADTSVLNLSKKLVDEMVIIIYSKEQVSNFTATKEEENKKIELCQNQIEINNDVCINNEVEENEIIGDTPVNNTISLNKATKEDLMTLPGIGASKANSIIDYRTTNGGFKNIEELKDVKGIGESIFDKIKNNITI